MPITGNNMHGGAPAPKRAPTFSNSSYPTDDEFKEFVDYLFQAKRAGPDGLMHASIGMAGEAAEVMDHAKKNWVYGRPVDLEKVIEEMGDTIHYFTMLLIKLEEITGQTWNVGDIYRNNVEKLQKRYPNGFSPDAAIARADKADPAKSVNEAYVERHFGPSC